MIGRTYLERGRPVVVLIRWAPGGGPRNVLIRRDDGQLVVRHSGACGGVGDHAGADDCGDRGVSPGAALPVSATDQTQSGRVCAHV
jgi:hypothetical protein